MIYLALTTDKISLITSAAITLDVNVNYIDAATSTLVVSGSGKQNTAITTATTTDILAAPGASTTRTLKQMTARNKHATLSGDVTVQFNANATLYELHKVTLLAGETLEYIEGVGFFTLKPAAGMDRTLRVASDVINATTSFADVTGLTLPLLSGVHYNFIAHLYSVNNATTTGSIYGVNIGAVPTGLLVGAVQVVTPTVATAAFGAGVATARDTDVIVSTTGAVTVKLDILSGWIQPSADGTFAIRQRSEVAVAAGITIKAGSYLKVWTPTS